MKIEKLCLKCAYCIVPTGKDANPQNAVCGHDAAKHPVDGKPWMMCVEARFGKRIGNSAQIVTVCGIDATKFSPKPVEPNR